MTFCRAVPLVVMLVGLPWSAAHAQFGGMPGMPGAAPGFGAAPPAPPPACQQLLTLRDQTAKHAQAIQAAGQRAKKPTPDEACKLFKAFLGSEAKMIKALEQNSTTCGVPPEMIKQVKEQHARAGQTGKQVCEVAARGAQPAGPSLSDALGTTPLVPDTADRNKVGGGTFDTLTGNALQR
jgi:hypothetical protein